MTILSDDTQGLGTESGPRAQETGACGGTAIAPTWRDAVRGVTGLSRPKGLTDRDVAAVYGLLEQLRAELEAPATAADEDVLASFARTVLLEWRLARAVFGQGALRKNGDARPALGELRQVIRLKVDLLSRLRFRNGKPPRKTLDAYLAGRRGEGVTAPGEAIASGADRPVGRAVDRPAAPRGRDEAGDSGDGRADQGGLE